MVPSFFTGTAFPSPMQEDSQNTPRPSRSPSTGGSAPRKKPLFAVPEDDTPRAKPYEPPRKKQLFPMPEDDTPRTKRYEPPRKKQLFPMPEDDKRKPDEEEEDTEADAGKGQKTGHHVYQDEGVPLSESLPDLDDDLELDEQPRLRPTGRYPRPYDHPDEFGHGGGGGRQGSPADRPHYTRQEYYRPPPPDIAMQSMMEEFWLLFSSYHPRRRKKGLFRRWWFVVAVIFTVGILSFSSIRNLPTLLGPWYAPLSEVLPFLPPPARPIGDYHLRGAPSLSAERIDDILASYGSPATGTGEAWVEQGKRYNIDPAYALAFFIHESTAGTHPNWAGLKEDGSTTHNVGNIICAGYPRCHGRFRDYQSWEEGIADWFRLIDVEYIRGRGTETVDEILPIYAPAFENDVEGYANAVKQMVDSWKFSEQQHWSIFGDTLTPKGNPLRARNTVMTQGYGIGTHAPSETWGAIDLAIDMDGDGEADPSSTQGHPIRATHSGIVKVTPSSWPAGNHIWVMNQSYKTSYAHLADFAVVSGQVVRQGDVIGSVGSTGQSSGPHLDYQVWKKEGGAWVNVNPLDFGALDQ